MPFECNGIPDQYCFSLGQVLKQYAEEPTGHLAEVLRDREKMRGDVYHQLEQTVLYAS